MFTTATECAWGRAPSSCGRSSSWKTTQRTPSTWVWSYGAAETALQLGKRYVQDQPLDWGCAVERAPVDLAGWCAPGTTMQTGKMRQQAARRPSRRNQRADLTMNDVIYETVVTTLSADGVSHVAPMGIRYRGDEVVLMPYRPSTTLDNIVATGCAVLNIVVDTRVFAGSVTGRKVWDTLPAERIPGVRLACALSHLELRLVSRQDRGAANRAAPGARARRRCACAVHRDQPCAGGGGRGAVLVSRLSMLPAGKVDSEMAYLQIAIDKTAGPGARGLGLAERSSRAKHRRHAQQQQ